MAYTTILVKGVPVVEEMIVEADLKPGHLVEITSAAKDTVKKHTVVGGTAPCGVVFEAELVGKTIRDTISAGDRAQVLFPRQGEQFLGRVADGEVVTKGDYVCSAGAGEVRKAAVPSAFPFDHPFAVALETVDMSGSAGADPEGFIILQRI